MQQRYAVNDYDYRRYDERKKYPTEVVFHHANRLYAGILRDISLGGAYIETYCVNQFSTKDIVAISIPFSSGQTTVRRRGSIKWINHTGFGVEFI